MIIYYSNFTWTIPCPHKDNAPLIIDPNTMKTRQISLQFFETVIWQSLQIIKVFRVTNHVELSQRNRRHSAPTRASGRDTALIQQLSSLIAK